MIPPQISKPFCHQINSARGSRRIGSRRLLRLHTPKRSPAECPQQYRPKRYKVGSRRSCWRAGFREAEAVGQPQRGLKPQAFEARAFGLCADAEACTDPCGPAKLQEKCYGSVASGYKPLEGPQILHRSFLEPKWREFCTAPSLRFARRCTHAKFD